MITSPLTGPYVDISVYRGRGVRANRYPTVRSGGKKAQSGTKSTKSWLNTRSWPKKYSTKRDIGPVYFDQFYVRSTENS